MTTYAEVTADRDVTAGEFVMIGSDAGYAKHDAAAGEALSLQVRGTFVEMVQASEDVERGRPVLFENGVFSIYNGVQVGIAYEDAITDSETARVLVTLGEM